MKKRIPLTFLALLFLLTGQALGDASAQLEQAEAYKQNKQYELAEAIYRAIVADSPGTDEALQAQKNLAVLYITTSKYLEARQEVDTLLTDFTDHPELPGEVYKIEAEYWRMKRYEDAKLLCEYITENHPDSDVAIKAQTSVAAADILLGNYAAAQAGIDALIRDFAKDPELAGMIWKLGIVSWIGEKYDWSRKFYQRVVDTWPQSSYAKRSRIGIIRADIKLGGKPNVLADANELSADFTDHPELVGEVYELAHDCCLLKRYEDARQLWQCVVDNCPGSNDMVVMRSRIGIIKADIKLGNHETADAATETMLARYSDHKNFPRIVCQLGDDYLESGQYEKARGLYQYVINKRPEDQMAILSHAGIGRVKIHFNDDLAAQTIIEYLITNFHDHPRLAQAVVRIGEEYYSRALEYRKQGLESQSKESFAKAISVWERMLRDISVESHTVYPAQAYYFSAISCGYLGQHEKAIDYYQAVADNWPDYPFAWNALFQVGRAYESLSKSGVVSKSEADSKTRSAYEQLLEKYPTCKAAKSTRRWLNRHN